MIGYLSRGVPSTTRPPLHGRPDRVKRHDAQGFSGRLWDFPITLWLAIRCRTAREQNSNVRGLAYTTRTACSVKVHDKWKDWKWLDRPQ